jgi:hypothetical protein
MIKTLALYLLVKLKYSHFKEIIQIVCNALPAIMMSIAACLSNEISGIMVIIYTGHEQDRTDRLV